MPARNAYAAERDSSATRRASVEAIASGRLAMTASNLYRHGRCAGYSG
jgi:hypothetical protein